MASIRKRGHKWQVQIRRVSSTPIAKSFHNRKDAEQWARQVEVQADRQDLPKDPKQLERTTLADIIIRYRNAVTPIKRSNEQERYALNAFLREPICSKSLSSLTQEDFASYRDRILQSRKPSSVTRMLATLHHVYETARKEWQLPVKSNPLSAVKVRQPLCRRERRVEQEELKKLVNAAEKTRNQVMLPVILFALETGLRRSELLSLRWADWNKEHSTIYVSRSKNGASRTVVLTSSAYALLQVLEQTIEEQKRTKELEDPIFPLTANSVRLAWQRLIKRANIRDLHFHDLRHEAISRFFEAGLTIPEVASQSGHRDARMLFRYSHAQQQRIRDQLNQQKNPNDRLKAS